MARPKRIQKLQKWAEEKFGPGEYHFVVDDESEHWRELARTQPPVSEEELAELERISDEISARYDDNAGQ